MHRSLAVACAAAVLISAVATAQKPSWGDCGSSKSMGKVTMVTMTPSTPVAGKNLTFEVALDLHGSGKVSNGTYSLVGDYYGSPMVTHTGPICGTDYWDVPLDPDVKLTATGLKCPEGGGSVVLKDQLSTPSFLPSGQVNVTVSAVDQSKQPVYCWWFALNLN